MPPEPILDANGNVSLVAMRAHNEALVENVGEFYLLNQFWVALPICNPCWLWIWIQRSGWPPSSSAPRTRPKPRHASRPFNKRKMRTVWKPLPKTVKRTSPHQINKIKDSRIAKTTARRTTTGTITSSNLDLIQETTPTRTRWPVFSAGNKDTGRTNAERGSTPTSPAWTWAVNHSGQKLTLLRMVFQSRPSRTRIFSSELDGTPTSSSCRHSSNYYEFVCGFNRDL